MNKCCVCGNSKPDLDTYISILTGEPKVHQRFREDLLL